jgi:hypothetical protein
MGGGWIGGGGGVGHVEAGWNTGLRLSIFPPIGVCPGTLRAGTHTNFSMNHLQYDLGPCAQPLTIHTGCLISCNSYGVSRVF